ncbi:MAG: response regulator [Endomicrobiales bacterium]|nr:response regulator [Endomicrobiales bacterium]
MKNVKILIVDDNDDIRTACNAALKTEGYSISQASSGEIAVKLIEQFKYDLVLTDYSMGEVSGLYVLKKAKMVDKECEVIMMTAFASQDLARQVLKEYTGTSFICKPIKIDELRKAVKYCIERRSTKIQIEHTRGIVKGMQDKKDQ